MVALSLRRRAFHARQNASRRQIIDSFLTAKNLRLARKNRNQVFGMRSALKLDAERQEIDMSTQEKPYTIVVGIDFSEASNLALDEALTLTTERRGELHVLYVDDQFQAPEGGKEAAEAALSRVEKHSLARIDHLQTRSGKAISFGKLYSHFRLGDPAEQIAQLASDLNADLIVAGTHGHSGIKRFVLGSVAESVVRFGRCPVLIVRQKNHEARGKMPEIEPPCPDCLAKRKETAGATFWCERHSEHHIRAHRYHYAGGEGSDRHSPDGQTSTPT